MLKIMVFSFLFFSFALFASPPALDKDQLYKYKVPTIIFGKYSVAVSLAVEDFLETRNGENLDERLVFVAEVSDCYYVQIAAPRIRLVASNPYIVYFEKKSYKKLSKEEAADLSCKIEQLKEKTYSIR